jgi:50S ribosomal subunit-associated GTPase HflX
VGQELKTTLRFDGRILEGVALLETDSLIFRGDVSLTVKFSEIFKVEANAGWLDMQTGRGLLLLELGAKAEIWAEKIKNPKALVEKLGIDDKKKVAVVGKLDAALRADLDATGAKIAKSARGKDFDIVFVAASAKKDLEKLPAIREMIRDDGAIWIVYPKGSGALTEREVLTAGRTLQLTDNKQVKVDEVLTSVRFVIPVAQRKKK